MGVLRDRSTIVAALLLATLAFAGVAGDSHRHDSLTTAAGHEDLPTFSAGHEQPDRTVHIEGATRIEPDSCLACLQRQRQGAVGRPAPALGGFAPDSSAIAAESARRLAADARLHKPSRAPPRA